MWDRNATATQIATVHWCAAKVYAARREIAVKVRALIVAAFSVIAIQTRCITRNVVLNISATNWVIRKPVAMGISATMRPPVRPVALQATIAQIRLIIAPVENAFQPANPVRAMCALPPNLVVTV